jgi:hypothetical protein
MQSLHEKALNLAKEFKRVEFELIDVLQKIDSRKLFRTLGYTSLFDYTTRALGLSESVAYGLITVSRKSLEVPQLKVAIESGNISVARAKMMTSVLTLSNATELIEKAKDMTHRELEKEVASLSPKGPTREQTKYISADRVELKVSLSEAVMKTIKRVQDLESQRTSKAINLEQTLEAMAMVYLERNDPLLKAERALQKPSAPKAHQQPKEDKVSTTNYRRTPLSAELKHKVHQRDQGQCVVENSDGQRCANRRWLNVHHRIPVSQGGENELQNLMTVCFFHHKIIHDMTERAS